MEIEAGRKPVVIYRQPYRPYKNHPKYKGFLALYVHYLYILVKMQKQQYPPRITEKLKQDVMRFEELREQFKFLRENGIQTEAQQKAFQKGLEDQILSLAKQRTILHVRKKKRQELYAALSTEATLAPVKALYEEGQTGFEAEYAQYMNAVKLPDSCGISREELSAEKAIYKSMLYYGWRSFGSW